MADIFISYAREDREYALKLAHALEAHGWSVWWDREILPGKDFAAVISTELAKAGCVIVLWSAASVASGWVRDEAHEGLERKVLVPVLIDGSEPPMGYRAIQGCDLSDWHENDDHPGFMQLIEAITQLRAAGPPAIAGTAAPARRRFRFGPRQRRILLLVIAAAIVAAILDLLYQVLGKKETPRPPLPERPPLSFRDCPRCPEMVTLAPGHFQMGASWFDRQAQSDERPIVDVTIAKEFAIGRHEVTFDDWQACINDGGCGDYLPEDRGWGRGRRPVIFVSWDDAEAYAAWLRKKTGKAYRLPTEAEWEFACRAGTATRYPFGDAILPEFANYNREIGKTREVGSYPANGWGIFDMNGNVWEWVQDVWTASHRGQPADGTAKTEGPDDKDRVIRGGSWDDRDRRVACTSRNRKDRETRENEIGFRVARSP